MAEASPETLSSPSTRVSIMASRIGLANAERNPQHDSFTPLFTALFLPETIRARLDVPGDGAVEPLSFSVHRALKRRRKLVHLPVFSEITHVYFHTHL